MNKATCKVVLDTKSKELEKKLFLSVTYKREAYKYSLGLPYRLTKEQFLNKNLKVTKEALAEAEPEKARAEQIIKNLGDNFTFAKFKALFKGTEKNESSMSDKIQDIFNHYLIDHPNLAQGTIDSYKTVINHLINYDKSVRLSDITIAYIQSFIKHLKENGSVNSDTTINIYLRVLRAMYNYAETKLYTDPRNNPFGRNKIKISSNSNVKKAINEKDFQKFLSYKPTDTREEFAHDMFLISFGLIGMNIADIVSIKNKDIDKDNILSYTRKKTQNRRNNATSIVIKVSKPTLELIKKHGVINPNSPNDYIFPFLTPSMSGKQELRKRKDITKKINQSLEDICKHINIEKITTYAARHTIATMLMNSGTTVEAISKSLGHSSIKVTQNYLAQISDKVANDISDKTTSFMTIRTEPVDADTFSKT